jgi:predicted small secreted protein
MEDEHMALLKQNGLAALLLLGLATLGACNTVQGMGRDIEAGGEAISDTSEKVQSEM